MYMARRLTVFKKQFLMVIILCFSPLSFLHAASSETAVISQAKKLILERKLTGALDILLSVEDRLAGNIDYDYLLGTVALDLGKADLATVSLERVLVIRPNFMGARIDLARAYFLLGDLDRAKQEFEVVSKNNPPATAKMVIDSHLKKIADIQEELDRPYRFFVEYSFGRDTNINFSNSSGQVAIPVFGNAIFTLNPINVATAKDFSQATAGITYDKKISPTLGLTGSYSYRLRDNINSSVFDSANQDYSGGFYFGAPTNRVSASLDGGRYELNSSLSRVSSGYLVDWKYAFGPSNQLTVFNKTNHTRFVGDLNINSFDSRVYGLNKLFILPGGNSLINASLLYGEENGVNGRADGNKYFHGLRLMAMQKLTPKWDAGLMVGKMSADYKKENASFLTKRTDSTEDLGIFSNYRIDSKTLISMTISKINNSSNIALYDFMRTEYLLKLRREF